MKISTIMRISAQMVKILIQQLDDEWRQHALLDYETFKVFKLKNSFEESLFSSQSAKSNSVYFNITFFK